MLIMYFTTSSTSVSVTNAPCTRLILSAPTGLNSISPFPIRFSAPPLSRITLESVLFDTVNAILDGMFALIRPVITFVEGRCVPRIRCIPAALAFCAIRHIESSTASGAVIMKSASSSMIMTILSMYA